MPQELKFKSTLDNKDFESAAARMEKIGAAAASRLEKTLGAAFGGNTVAAVALKQFGNLQSAIEKIRVNVVRTFDTGKEYNQLARQTGANVAGLVVLGAKFKQAGMDSGQLSSAIARLQKSLAGIEDEDNAGAGSALGKLGLTLKQLRRESPDQQLFAVGSALGKIADPADRAATAMKIFGRSGAELGAVFNSSSFANISPELQRRAQLFARNSEAFERASRSITRVNGIVQASANTFYMGVAEGVVKGLQPLLDDMKATDFTAQGQTFGRALGEGASAIHEMLAELKASGLIELGEKLAAGATKTVGAGAQAVGDLSIAAGAAVSGGDAGTPADANASAARTVALMGIQFLFGQSAQKVKNMFAGAHAMMHIGDSARAYAADLERQSDERYADLHNNPADPGAASTNRRPETRATNNRPLTLPGARRAVTLPSAAGRLKPSAPGGVPTVEQAYEDEFNRRRVAMQLPPNLAAAAIRIGNMSQAVAMGASTPERIVINGENDQIGDAMDRYNARYRALHRMGQTALSGDPTTRPDWKGAPDAFNRFTKQDWANYRGTTSYVYGGHTSLTSGGLGGGAYGRTGGGGLGSNIWNQISGRVSGSGDPTKDTADHTKEMAGHLRVMVRALSGGGSGGGGGGVTVTN